MVDSVDVGPVETDVHRKGIVVEELDSHRTSIVRFSC